ncbi:glycosyltransferase family 4 protein [Halococcoides cellulosivorans]|nr:glycosyltransferase family 4 protein [Halococcoides cellulosivorans]
MDIAFITPRYPPTVVGGGEISLKLLSENLAKQDWVDRVSVYSFDGRDSNLKNGVEVVRVSDLTISIKETTNYFAYRALQPYVDDLCEFDIVHSYNMKFHPLVGYLAKKYNISAVATLNSFEFISEKKINMGWSRPLRRIYKEISLKLMSNFTLKWKDEVDVITALSNSIRSIYVNNGFPTSKIHVIPNMVDPELYSGNTRTRGNGTRLLYVGALKKTKGVADLVKSLKYLPDEFTLRVGGTGSDSGRIKDIVDENNLNQRVEFAGWVDHEEISEFYSSGDIFVHPGIWPEPFGRTLIEAMQHGLPVVATNIGAAPEIIPQDNLLCEPGSPQDIARAITEAHDDHKRYGESNMSYVNDEYAPKRVLNKYNEIYSSIA